MLSRRRTRLRRLCWRPRRNQSPPCPRTGVKAQRALEQAGAAQGLKLGKAQAPVRVAVTGRTIGLPLFESLELLGRERTLERLRAVLERLNA